MRFTILRKRVQLACTSAVKRTSGPRRLFTTYYDSQSGLHLPVHNDKEISLFLNKRSDATSTTASSFVPAQLYKEDASSSMPDELMDLQKRGIHGVFLPPSQFPRDLRNLQTLSAIAPPNFRLLASIPSSLSSAYAKILGPLTNVSVVLDMDSGSDGGNTNPLTEPLLVEHTERGLHTTLSLHDIMNTGADAMSVASRVASLLDSAGGGQFLWVSSSEPSLAGADELVELCEELMYLDVAGPTIQSRLVVDANNEELIDEVMLAGVNKFVVEDEDQIGAVEEIAKWQGKAIAR